MKKNDLLLIIATAVYSSLFYRQDADINFLIFSIALIVLLVIRNKEVMKYKSWLAAASGTLISGAGVMLYGNGLSVTANIISLFALSAFSIRPETSFITSLFHSVYSIASSCVHMIIDAVERSMRKPSGDAPPKRSNAWMLYVLPLIIVFLFFLLYKSSNPLFDNLTQKINLDFISIGWCVFTIFGFLLMYGFFYHKTIPPFTRADESLPNTISNDFSGPRLWNLSIDTEYRSGVFLLLLLNALLLVVNLLDANFIFIDGTLPAGLTYSDYVHQGTGTLIFSIIIAILLILFYFRGELNFYQKKPLKWLAALWLLQNCFMIFSTAFRNHLYIEVYSLTYRRIGVYVWLLLALIGLVTTFVKIFKMKSNWFLFRSNGWLFYAVLVISCCFHWDVIITEYNIGRALTQHKAVDKFYLLSLSDQTLPQLIEWSDAVKNEYNMDADHGRAVGHWNASDEDFREILQYAAVSFYIRMQAVGWRSWNYSDARAYAELLQLEAGGKINLHSKPRGSVLPNP